MLINFIGFYVLWLGLVVYGNYFVPIAITALAAHLYFVVKEKNLIEAELKLILSVVLIGIVIDSSLTMSSIFIFDKTHPFSQAIIPFWLIMLWAVFAATLRHSLAFLMSNRTLQRVVGAVFAPVSYIAGYSLGAVEFGFSVTTTYLLLAFIWALILSVCFDINDWIENDVSELTSS